jgi:cytochrome c
MRKITLLIVLFMLASLLLAACGGGDTEGAGPGDAERGKTLFEQTIIGPSAAPGCTTCHSIEPGKVLVGPSLAGIAAFAESAVPGKSAEDFLKESILSPNAVVTEGFTASIMYQNYSKDLSAQEINDLVAYLLSLK